jgi:hypothetical protein
MADRLGDRQIEERPAAPENDDPVARLLDVGDDMGRQERGVAAGANGLNENVEELAPGERIEARKRLVEQQDPGPRPERERQSHLGLLAARQLAGQGPQGDREAVDVRRGEGGIEPPPERCRERQVVGDRQGRVERRRLRDVADPADGSAAVTLWVDAAGDEAPLGRPLEPDPGADQRRLARAVGPDERRDRASRHREIDAAERPAPPPIALAVAGGLECRVHGPPRRP